MEQATQSPPPSHYPRYQWINVLSSALLQYVVLTRSSMQSKGSPHKGARAARPGQAHDWPLHHSQAIQTTRWSRGWTHWSRCSRPGHLPLMQEPDVGGIHLKPPLGPPSSRSAPCHRRTASAPAPVSRLVRPSYTQRSPSHFRVDGVVEKPNRSERMWRPLPGTSWLASKQTRPSPRIDGCAQEQIPPIRRPDPGCKDERTSRPLLPKPPK